MGVRWQPICEKNIFFLFLSTPCFKSRQSLQCFLMHYCTNQIIKHNLHVIAWIALHLWPESECVTSFTLPMMCNIAHMDKWKMIYRLKSAVCLALTPRNFAGNQSSDAEKVLQQWIGWYWVNGAPCVDLLHNSDRLHPLAFFQAEYYWFSAQHTPLLSETKSEFD